MQKLVILLNLVRIRKREKKMSLSFSEVVRILAEGKIPSPRLEARILFEYLELNQFAPAEGDKEAQLRALLNKRLAHAPLDKILGKREFYKNTFAVSKDVLSPRPDTEILVEAAIDLTEKKIPQKILDLGTGSGCILLSILADCPQACGMAVDKSEAALAVAHHNAKALNLFNRVTFMHADWFERDFVEHIGSGFDLVVSNPPYIPTADILTLEPEVRQFDPILALDGGKDGFEHYRRIAELTPHLLKQGGHILLEAGIGQASKIGEIFEHEGLHLIEIRPDLSGIERCVILKK